MDKNIFDINKSSLTITTTELTNNYSHKIINYNDSKTDSIELKTKYIGILPFEINKEQNVIASVFLNKSHNFIKDDIKKTLILIPMDDSFDTQLDVVYNYFEKNLAIPLKDTDLEKIFYLGNIEMNDLISGDIPCYSINITDMITAKENIFKINSELPQVVQRIDYSEMLKGVTHDMFAISATFLLLSYLS